MDHKRVKELFTEYRDRELDEETRTSMGEHLAQCADCTAEWVEFDRTVEEISGLFQMKPPPDLAQSVETRIRRRSRGRFFAEQKTPAGMQFALVSFILVLLFLLAYLVLTATTEITILEGAASDSEKSDAGEISSKEPSGTAE